MLVELSKEEIEMIELWYCASAGESAHIITGEDTWSIIEPLLAKLGIPIHHADKYWFVDRLQVSGGK